MLPRTPTRAGRLLVAYFARVLVAALVSLLPAAVLPAVTGSHVAGQGDVSPAPSPDAATPAGRVAALPPGSDRARLAWLLSVAEARTSARGDAAVADAATAAAARQAVADALNLGRGADEAFARLPHALAGALILTGRIGLALDRRDGQLAVAGLFDLARERDLLAAAPGRVWEVVAQAEDGRTLTLSPADAWAETEVRHRLGHAELRWAGPRVPGAEDLVVRLAIGMDGPEAPLRLRVENRGRTLALLEIAFPVVRLPVTDDDAVLAPGVSGRVHRRPVSSGLHVRGEYPGGWLFAHLAGTFGPAGAAYLGVHDPMGSAKRPEMDADAGGLRVAWLWPAPDAGKPGNEWEAPGPAVVAALEGDWFDLAQRYRRWASGGDPQPPQDHAWTWDEPRPPPEPGSVDWTVLEERLAAERRGPQPQPWPGAAWWPHGPQAGRPDTPAWTWHFQEAEGVPLFAAIYGGQVVVTGRAYQGDSWRGPALRQKTAQALAWGEQLGWIDLAVADDSADGAFFVRLARLRHALRRYFAEGRMARPPRATDDGATVTADWRWGGSRIVTTPAVISGAWHGPDGGLVIVLVNVDDKPHAVDLGLDPAAYGFAAGADVLVRERTGAEPPDAPSPPQTRGPGPWKRRVALEALSALAVEVTPAP
jgi:hypothetical protein